VTNQIHILGTTQNICFLSS